MRAISKSFDIALSVGYLTGRERGAERAKRAIGLRLTEALAVSYSPTGLEDLGRWAHQQVKAVIRAATPKLPEGVIITGVTITYYTEPDKQGRAVMKVDGRTGRVVIF